MKERNPFALCAECVHFYGSKKMTVEPVNRIETGRVITADTDCCECVRTHLFRNRDIIK